MSTSSILTIFMAQAQEHPTPAGVKLVEEFMVDIFGCIMPGIFFMTVVILSSIIPLALCNPLFFQKVESVAREANGSFWWVLFFLFLIMSYMVGELLIMGTVDKPDGISIEAEVRNKVKNFRFNDRKFIIESLNKYVALISKALCHNREFFAKETANYLELSCQYISSLKIDKHNYDRYKTDNEFLSNLLVILFPEDAFMISGRSMYADVTDYLSTNSNDTINSYQEIIGGSGYLYDDISLFCFILMIQMDCGLNAPKNSKYPYQNYYKYLIFRERFDILPFVKWGDKTSKQSTNPLKLKIKLTLPRARAIIDKNESHIRLMSSLYYCSRVLFPFTILCVVTSIIVRLSTAPEMYDYLLLSLPVLMVVSVCLVRKYSVRHIHYQRMREIQNIIEIYSQCQCSEKKETDNVTVASDF